MLIDAIQNGHRKYYRYHKKGASIKEQPINQEELDLIHNALILLKRFEGVLQFEWLDDLENDYIPQANSEKPWIPLLVFNIILT